MAQSGPKIQAAQAANPSFKPGDQQYNYFWKLFDFRGGRTFKDVHEDHPYCKDPISSMDQRMLLFHLGDSYFFLNELMKTQAITKYEN